MENKNNEIDLFELFFKFVSFFKKYLKLFVITIISALSLAFSYYIFTPKLYKSNVIVKSSNQKVLVSLFESLNEEFSVNNISKNFNIPKSIAKKIIEIETEINYEEEFKADSSYFKIYVTVNDSSVFKNVEKGIVYFAENNKYINLIDSIDKLQRNNLINFIDKEINKLDSIRLKNAKVKNIYIENKTDNNSEILTLFLKKQELIKVNKTQRKIELIKDFSKVNSLSVKNKLLFIVFFTLIIGFIISIFLEINFVMKNNERKD